MRKTITSVFISYFLLAGPVAFSQWSDNPSINTLIPNETSANADPQVIDDNLNGAFVVYTVKTSEFTQDLYAQHVSNPGIPLWTPHGILLCHTSMVYATRASVIADGSGGLIVAWSDNRDGGDSIYIQKIGADGTTFWGDNGKAITSTQSLTQGAAQLTSDGSGGAFVSWVDYGGLPKVYAQKINSTGALEWSDAGMAVCNSIYQSLSKIASDGANGIIVVWMDPRFGHSDLFAQRFNATGNSYWTADGITITNMPHSINFVEIVPDNHNGAILVWSDDRYGGDEDVFAQNILADGTVRWTTNGVDVFNDDSEITDVKLTHDSLDNTFVSITTLLGVPNKVIVQKLRDGDGATLWGNNGVLCTDLPGDQSANNGKGPDGIISDGSGGVIIVWSQRIGDNYDVYAQRIDPNGLPLWSASGAIVANATGSQELPDIVKDGYGGAIIAFNDYRNGGDSSEIYIQRICANGQLGNCSLGTTANTYKDELSVYPNPASNTVSISASELIKRIVVSDVLGKTIITTINDSLTAEVNVAMLKPGTYFLRLLCGENEIVKKLLVK